MFAMSPELRQTIVHARTAEYSGIMRTVIFAFAVIGAALHFGPGDYSAPLMVLTLTVTAYGVLAGGSALDDIHALKSDMTDDFKATTYGVGVLARDILKLKLASSVMLGLTGLAVVLAISL